MTCFDGGLLLFTRFAGFHDRSLRGVQRRSSLQQAGGDCFATLAM